jgi:hypothetical protein
MRRAIDPVANSGLRGGQGEDATADSNALENHPLLSGRPREEAAGLLQSVPRRLAAQRKPHMDRHCMITECWCSALSTRCMASAAAGAVIFDLDGTLLDTEPAYFTAYHRAALE